MDPPQNSLCHRSVHDNTPLYLSDLLQKHNPSRLLRSASRSLHDVPEPTDSKTKRYGQRAFRYVAPSLWNVLPESIKEKDSIQSFRPSLRTYFLFRLIRDGEPRTATSTHTVPEL